MSQLALLTEADGKRWTTLQARLYLARGQTDRDCYTATKIDNDHGHLLVVVTRWAMTRAFDSLDEFEAFVIRAEGVG